MPPSPKPQSPTIRRIPRQWQRGKNFKGRWTRCAGARSSAAGKRTPEPFFPQCDIRQRALEAPAPGDPVPVGQLARRMGVAQPTVSIHLNILRRWGLLYTRRAGRNIEYQCAPGLVRLELLNGKLMLTVSR